MTGQRSSCQFVCEQTRRPRSRDSGLPAVPGGERGADAQPVDGQHGCRTLNRLCLNLWRRGAHSRLNSSWPGSAVHGAFEGLQTINPTFCLAVAPGHLDSVFYRIEIPVQCVREAHDGRQVGFDRVVDPCRERVCLAATQDTLNRMTRQRIAVEGGRASLGASDFPPDPGVSFPRV